MNEQTMQTIIDTAEALGWKVTESKYEPAIAFSQYSPAGEDFGFCVDSTSPEELLVDMWDYYQSFSPDEHAVGWYNAGSGEPSSLRDLLDDAEAIDGMIRSLYLALLDVLKENGKRI